MQLLKQLFSFERGKVQLCMQQSCWKTRIARMLHKSIGCVAWDL